MNEKGREELLLLLAATLLAGLLGRLENGLECGRGLECKGLRSFNLELLAGAGVTTGAGCTGLHLERTETDELNLIATLNSVGDGAKYSGESGLGALLSSVLAQLGLNAVNKLCLIHRPL